MALWGVSGSDVINCGRNTAVGLGVFAGCALTAYGVKKVAAIAFDYSKTIKPEIKELCSKSAGAVFGLAAAAAAYKFAPASRFASISEYSTSKMFKLGAVQAAVGLVIDHFVIGKFYIATSVGIGCAQTARFGYLALAGLGALGAGLGSGFISK